MKGILIILSLAFLGLFACTKDLPPPAPTPLQVFGTVYDAVTSEPLEGIAIFFSGDYNCVTEPCTTTDHYVVTDSLGQYVLSCADCAENMLVFCNGLVDTFINLPPPTIDTTHLAYVHQLPAGNVNMLLDFPLEPQ